MALNQFWGLEPADTRGKKIRKRSFSLIIIQLNDYESIFEAFRGPIEGLKPGT